jgi:hypothetical protein
MKLERIRAEIERMRHQISRQRKDIQSLQRAESGAFDSFWKDGVMAKPYSDDLRVRAIAIVEGGASRHEVAALLEVSPSSVINWLRRWSDDGRQHGNQVGTPRGIGQPRR